MSEKPVFYFPTELRHMVPAAHWIETGRLEAIAMIGFKSRDPEIERLKEIIYDIGFNDDDIENWELSK